MAIAVLLGMIAIGKAFKYFSVRFQGGDDEGDGFHAPTGRWKSATPNGMHNARAEFAEAPTIRSKSLKEFRNRASKWIRRVAIAKDATNTKFVNIGAFHVSSNVWAVPAHIFWHVEDRASFRIQMMTAKTTRGFPEPYGAMI